MSVTSQRTCLVEGPQPVHTKIIYLSAPGRERLSAELNELVDRIELGSSVTVAALDLDESLNTYRIVSSVEANSQRGLVSEESPLGRALLGRSVGEDVTILFFVSPEDCDRSPGFS